MARTGDSNIAEIVISVAAASTGGSIGASAGIGAITVLAKHAEFVVDPGALCLWHGGALVWVSQDSTAHAAKHAELPSNTSAATNAPISLNARPMRLQTTTVMFDSHPPQSLAPSLR
jgi:hypothetical protein